MDFTQRKLLMSDQFVWVINTQDGKFGTFVGPSPLTDVKDEDIPLTPAGANTDQLTNVDGVMNAVQKCIILKDDEYAILHNPTESSGSQTPNGRWESNQRNPLPTLLKGKKRVITEGSFPLWPTQWVEIKKVHSFKSNQYLIVEVESEVDIKAPYYSITEKCAQITQAIVDETIDSKDEKEIKISDISTESVVSDEDEHTEEGTETTSEETSTDEKTSTDEVETTSSMPEKPITSQLRIGQRIIIQGTERYIPPTGIKVVVEGISKASEKNQKTISSDEAVNKIKRYISNEEITFLSVSNILRSIDMYSQLERLSDNYDHYSDEYSPENALWKAMQRTLDKENFVAIYNAYTASKFRDPAVNVKSDDPAIQNAVVLGATEFCVLIDEEGKGRTKEGPGRVFPGPYDTIRTKDSRNGVYDSYHIRPDRGILLRIVANGVTIKDVLELLPKGVSAESFNSEKTFQKGDEIFIGGVDAYVVPHSIFEVIDPVSREPHIGNDHDNVYVKAIAVDQKSGVYVSAVETGNIALEKGETNLLLDPRKYTHVKRRVPGTIWNLLIGHSEPHKKVHEGEIIETPWALSVVIPNNEALLITSKDGRRVVKGPRTELLGYEETGEVLTLSTGSRKSNDHQLKTCFLRVEGNRVSDQVDLVTSDKIRITVSMQYGVRFVAKDDEEAQRWFNTPDYIQLLVTRTRSLLRANAQLKTLMELDQDMAGFIRDTTLGIKGNEDEHRKGWFFPENNMLIEEVDVLDYRIEDSEIAMTLQGNRRTMTTRLIEDASLQAKLKSDELREDIAKKTDALKISSFARIQETAIKKAEHDKEVAIINAEVSKEQSKLTDQVRRLEIELGHKRTMLTTENEAHQMLLSQNIADEEAILVRKRSTIDHSLRISQTKKQRKATVDFRNALVEIQKAIIATEGEWDVKRISAIQPGLIEAIEGLGDKQALQELATSLPEATGSFGFLTEAGGMAALKTLVKGTKFERTLNALSATEEDISAENHVDARSLDDPENK